jgi:DNA repair exonuclease SbcCD nuclease subunit
MKYTCLRCGYETENKTNIVNHFKRKKKCPCVFCDIDTEKFLEILKLKNEDYKDEIIKISSEIIINKESYVSVNLKLLKQLEEKDKMIEERNKMIEEKDKNCLDENIYLIQPRSCVDNNEQVYKLGRTNNLKLRFNKYCKGGLQKMTYPCTDSVKAEKELLFLFNEKFKIREDYGKEYFEGEIKEMVRIISGYFI